MMRNHIAERFQHYSGGLSLDTEALKRYPDVIDLSIGDTDFTTDRRIIDAAFADACAGYTHYGDPKGDPELISAIRRAWKEDFGQDVSEQEVLVTTSSCIGMSQALMGILNPGDEVIVFGPYFADYASQAALAGGRAVEVPTYEADAYRPQEDALRRAITPKTRAMIVNTPCNPTGAAYDMDTLQMLARVAQEYDLLILADEIYTRYLYDGEFIPMRTLPGMADRTVTLNSFSKNFLMTGWRVGYIIAHPELIQVFKAVNDALTYAAPSISQRAAIKALSIRDEIAEAYIRKYRDRVFYASDCIEKIPYLTLLRPRGTFYLFPGIQKTGMDDRTFASFLLEKAHLLVSPGCAFGKAGEGHFRIACTVSRDKLEEAMKRLAALAPEFE
ncbi:MAG: aminotransferase class I/II-fold pyridoxal phosphate-dependent enzyme [Clostridia bacterium]|nr:aminotransferase class I/II-fold pyridoxal phosphate-dependent enzyme [Clostridia bacterium]